MSNLHKRVELLANVAIVVVAVLLAVVLVQRYLLPAAPAPENAETAQLKPGTKLTLPVDWGGNKQTLLMVLSTNCHFCTESAPFYQRLAEEKAKHGWNVRMVAVMPQSIDESQKYLKEHGVSVDEIKQAQPTAIGVRGTPTLIMVDGQGAVVEAWVGKLPTSEEVKVLNRFVGEQAGD
ncbi:MAG TPA: redoxin family protein [Pyrinomonadaceae bacterium]|nr:redoxin family protein [Pyrinomonadaceae bacterium]